MHATCLLALGRLETMHPVRLSKTDFGVVPREKTNKHVKGDCVHEWSVMEYTHT